MASENLVKELWEIIQKENKEEISYNDFENDLNKVLNLPKDESDRAISLMISQAEVNPNLIGEYKDGSFMISSSFAAIIVSTIKYENQFIPGKREYESRILSNDFIGEAAVAGAIIMTPQLLDSMIENFDNLTIDEQSLLASSFVEMTQEQKDKFAASIDSILEKKEKESTTPEEKEKVENARMHNKRARETAKNAAKGDKDSIEELKQTFKNMKKNNPELFNAMFARYFHEQEVDIDGLPDEIIVAMAEINYSIEALCRVNEQKAKDGQKTVVDVSSVKKPVLSEEAQKFLKENYPRPKTSKDATNYSYYYSNDRGDLPRGRYAYSFFEKDKIDASKNFNSTTYNFATQEVLDAIETAESQVSGVEIGQDTIKAKLEELFEMFPQDETQKIELMATYMKCILDIETRDRKSVVLGGLEDYTELMVNKILKENPNLEEEHVRLLLSESFNGKVLHYIGKEPDKLVQVFGGFLQERIESKIPVEERSGSIIEFVSQLKGVKNFSSPEMQSEYIHVYNEERFRHEAVAKKAKKENEERETIVEEKTVSQKQRMSLEGNDEVSQSAVENPTRLIVEENLEMYGLFDGYDDEEEEKTEEDHIDLLNYDKKLGYARPDKGFDEADVLKKSKEGYFLDPNTKDSYLKFFKDVKASEIVEETESIAKAIKLMEEKRKNDRDEIETEPSFDEDTVK